MHRIQGPRVGVVLNALAAYGHLLHTAEHGSEHPVSLAPLGFFAKDAGQLAASGALDFWVRTHDARLAFSARHVGEDQFSQPTAIDCYTRRAARRIEAPAALRVSVPGFVVSRVVDVSWYGLLLEVDKVAPDSAPMRTATATIAFPGETMTVDVVVHLRAEDRIALEIARPDPRKEALPRPLTKWFLFLERKLYPMTARDEPEAAFRTLGLWYADLPGPGPGALQNLREDFIEVGRQLADRPMVGHLIVHKTPFFVRTDRDEASPSDALAVDETLTNEDTVARVTRRSFDVLAKEKPATIAFLHLYAKTWIGHQLGLNPLSLVTDQSEATRVKRELYDHAFGTVARDPTSEWFGGACRLIKWMQRHWDPTLDFGEYACCVPLRPLEIYVRAPKQRTSVELLRVEPLEAQTRVVRQMFVDALGRQPPAYREALDLVEARLDLADANAWLARHGDPENPIRIEREVVVASIDDNSPLAAAVIEWTTLGTNAFRLFDAVRIFELAEGMDPVLRAVARQSLLEAARTRYASLGRPMFVYHLEHHGEAALPDYMAAFEHDDGEEGFMWLVSTKYLTQFKEWVWERTAPRG